MNALCAIGIHKWRDHYRVLNEPVREQYMHPVIPSLFSGPPYLMPTGIYFTVTRKYVCRQCRRCGRKAP